MRDADDTIGREDARESSETGDAEAVPPSRRMIGVVRVLRGRLAAPCGCCSDATAARVRLDDDARR